MRQKSQLNKHLNEAVLSDRWNKISFNEMSIDCIPTAEHQVICSGLLNVIV